MPTVTTSRLKCLTTGAIPSFIDIGTSFSGSSVTEDNLLDQLVFRNSNSSEQIQCKKHNKNLWVFGDNTWEQLYPSQNSSSKCSVWSFTDVVPSFNVKDFHGNDRTVLKTTITVIQILVRRLIKLTVS
ncbi:MAG: hypothetical protein EZS28_043818 [Streblomastix strix]|uniref:Uncharacterized protein n=1 Tax=Streblomastix strix TaxID=222440 RepID=A0A5J4TTI4_9EUKA|nr:MAG: hypothetical protein EZS28_043818 [Streblomastix strix]